MKPIQLVKKFLIIFCGVFLITVCAQPLDLISLLRQQGVEVIVVGDQLKVIFGTDRFFQGISTTRIKPGCIPTLNLVAQLFRSHGDRLITISGHTDNVGTDRDKLKRSYQQANTVAAYFWSQGFPLRNMIVIGCGDTEPVASNRTIPGSAANRRIEIESGGP